MYVIIYACRETFHEIFIPEITFPREIQQPRKFQSWKFQAMRYVYHGAHKSMQPLQFCSSYKFNGLWYVCIYTYVHMYIYKNSIFKSYTALYVVAGGCVYIYVILVTGSHWRLTGSNHNLFMISQMILIMSILMMRMMKMVSRINNHVFQVHATCNPLDCSLNYYVVMFMMYMCTCVQSSK